MASKAPKAWALPKFWVSIRSYKKQPVKKIWGRILGLAWLKFAVGVIYHLTPMTALGPSSYRNGKLLALISLYRIVENVLHRYSLHMKKLEQFYHFDDLLEKKTVQSE